MERYRIVMEFDVTIERDIFNEAAKMIANRANSLNGLRLVYLATEEVIQKKRMIMFEKD